MNGREYLESLRDGREVWIHGERIADVTAHPAFRNPVRMVARMYDALHDQARAQVLLGPTDTGSGGRTHKFFKAARSAEDLVGSRDAIAEWARISYGWMGRSPDYKASFLATLDAHAGACGDYADNARRWYRHAQETLPFVNHAIVNPPIDRGNPEGAVDILMRVEEETDAGLVVSGAKVVATASAMTHYNFIGSIAPLPIRDARFAVTALVPTGAPGVKLLCRPSYAMAAETMGSPFDYPLSSRMDENDAILVFDRVLVPWENVLTYGDVRATNQFLPSSGFTPRYVLHGCTRLAVKLDFMAGLLAKALETTGADGFRGVQAQLGEVLALRSMVWGMSDAMARTPTPFRDGTVLPNVEYALSFRALSPNIIPRVREIVERVVASGLIYVPSHAKDFQAEEIRPYLDRYVRGSAGHDAVERVKTMKLLWDAIGSEFGARHALYERNYGGNHEGVAVDVLTAASASGSLEGLRGFVDRCMDEYDLDGWRSDDLIDGHLDEERLREKASRP